MELDLKITTKELAYFAETKHSAEKCTFHPELSFVEINYFLCTSFRIN